MLYRIGFKNQNYDQVQHFLGTQNEFIDMLLNSNDHFRVVTVEHADAEEDVRTHALSSSLLICNPYYSDDLYLYELWRKLFLESHE